MTQRIIFKGPTAAAIMGQLKAVDRGLTLFEPIPSKHVRAEVQYNNAEQTVIDAVTVTFNTNLQIFRNVEQPALDKQDAVRQITLAAVDQEGNRRPLNQGELDQIATLEGEIQIILTDVEQNHIQQLQAEEQEIKQLRQNTGIHTPVHDIFDPTPVDQFITNTRIREFGGDTYCFMEVSEEDYLFLLTMPGNPNLLLDLPAFDDDGVQTAGFEYTDAITNVWDWY